jgi:glycogen debranching enzyme
MRTLGDREWLEADGRGGFASGTVAGTRTRRYHALLLKATTPPTGRVVLVNGFDAWVETGTGRYDLSSQHYLPDVLSPAGADRIESFEDEPWPTWVYRLEDGMRVGQEVFVHRGTGATCVGWRLLAGKRARLSVRPFMSGRDYHSLHHENRDFRFDAAARDGALVWRPYDGGPEIMVHTNGAYTHEPNWYRDFLHQEERDRGLDDVEALAAPGVFAFELVGRRRATLVFGANVPFERLRDEERRRRASFATPLDRAADSYLVARGEGKTIIAGYPWFTDWGRDTFVALRGLCLATGRLDDARQILLEWSGAVSEGMLPNRFPDKGESPEYNSVDASLWYVVAVHEYLAASGRDEPRLRAAVDAILGGYARGTRHGIRMDDDGLLRAGEPGVQLTWMDAKVGDWVVTPRIGKPVEVNALWINALRIGGHPAYERARASFEGRFWNEARGCLFDVVDPDDATFRPNQVLAVGGLPFPVMEGERARSIVDSVEERLWTPLGLRSLAPGEPGYAPRYMGGVRERDGAYHQGTVWPWLMGPFVDAWVRVRGGGAAAKRRARSRFLDPLLAHAHAGHLPEIADADAPHLPRGCPFQAWSLSEALRLDRVVLAGEEVSRRPRGRSKTTSRRASRPAPQAPPP